MKPILLPHAELKSALSGLSKVLPRRSLLPVLATVKVERTSEGWIALTTTDLDSFVTVRLEQPADGEATSLLLPYEDLLKTSKACGREDGLLVQTEETAGAISGLISYPVGGQLVEHRCTSLPVDEFPALPKFRTDAVPLSPTLRQSIHEAFECASDDPTRLTLNGAFLDVSRPEGHYVVATDGRQLYSSNSFKLPLAESVMIPSHRFLGWKEFNADGDWQMKVGIPEKKDEPASLQLTSRRWRFICRQIEGTYPNWRQVLPADSCFNTTVELDTETLSSLLQTVQRMPCHNEQYMTLGLAIRGGTLSLLGRPPGAEQWTKVEVAKAKVRGSEVTTFIDRRYLFKALSFGLHKIEINDPLSPLRLSQAGRQMIVMPMRPEVAPNPPRTSAASKEPRANSETSSAAEVDQPAASAAAQPRSNSMNATPQTPAESNDNSQPPAEMKSPLELALEQIESAKSTCREAVRRLGSLADLIKQAQREQKTSDKEISSVRQTLRSLQSVRI